jgi:hypothetical protein
VVRLLLEHGSAVNVTSNAGQEKVKHGVIAIGHMTPLMMASTQGYFETVEMLIKAGADCTPVDVRGLNALALAVGTDRANPRTIRLLLDKGADKKAAMEIAVKYRNPEILKMLGLQAPAVSPQAHMAAGNRDARKTVEKAVGLLQTTSARFMETGGCPACHAQHTTGLAVDAAQRKGAKLDEKTEAAQARNVAAFLGALEQSLYQVQDPPVGTEGIEFSLMQMAASKVPPSPSIDSLVYHMAAMQRNDGSWPNYGLMRPPLEDSNFSHTAKGIRVLQLCSIPRLARRSSTREFSKLRTGWSRLRR